MSRSFLPAVIFLLAVIAALAQTGAHAQQQEMKPAAQAPFAQGVAAAKQQKWQEAIQFLIAAHQADPDASQIWFNLGLAQSKLPGYDLRSLAWFQAYLLAAPDAPNANAVREQVRLLEAGFESKIDKIFDAMETGTGTIYYGDHAGEIRNYIGQPDKAIKALTRTFGSDWLFKARPADIGSFAASGRLSVLKAYLAKKPITFTGADRYLLEGGNVDLLVQELKKAPETGQYEPESLEVSWRLLAYFAYERGNAELLEMALARSIALIERQGKAGKYTPKERFGIGIRCSPAASMFDFLTKIGRGEQARKLAAALPGGSELMKNPSTLSKLDATCEYLGRLYEPEWTEEARLRYLITFGLNGTAEDPMPLWPWDSKQQMAFGDTRVPQLLEYMARAMSDAARQPALVDGAKMWLAMAESKLSVMAYSYRQIRGPFADAKP